MMLSDLRQGGDSRELDVGLNDGRGETGLLGLPLSVVRVVAHGFSLGRVTEIVLNSLLGEGLPQVQLEDTVLTSVVSEQGLLILTGEVTLRVGAGVGPAVREYFVNSVLEVLHDEVVLLLPVLVLRLGLEPAQLAGVRGTEPVGVLGQAGRVQHLNVGVSYAENNLEAVMSLTLQ